jgi:hypothetical protein
VPFPASGLERNYDDRSGREAAVGLDQRLTDTGLARFIAQSLKGINRGLAAVISVISRSLVQVSFRLHVLAALAFQTLFLR